VRTVRGPAGWIVARSAGDSDLSSLYRRDRPTAYGRRLDDDREEVARRYVRYDRLAAHSTAIQAPR
jgi:hypothetical protein